MKQSVVRQPGISIPIEYKCQVNSSVYNTSKAIEDVPSALNRASYSINDKRKPFLF